MKLAASVEAAIVAHARAAAPQECCGLLIGTPDTITAAVAASNVAEDPVCRYVVDPRDHLAAIRRARQQRQHVVGAYHSHPRGVPEPSATDAAEAFPDFLWLIVGLGPKIPEVRAWQWTNGNFTPVTLVRVPEGEG